jgi:hypothetical protein
MVVSRIPGANVGLSFFAVSLLLAGLALLGDSRSPSVALALLGWGALACGATILVSTRGRAGSRLAGGHTAEAVADSMEPTAETTAMDRMDSKRFADLTQEALRRLNRSSALAKCPLIDELKYTLELAQQDRATEPSLAPTPLEQARTLREILVTAIDRLNPSREYEILHQEYVLGMPTSHIMHRLSVSEGGLHNWRRKAVEALANDLRTREEALATGISPEPIESAPR